jgi:1-acyl-sn-glycerol-3-phosphate acyltransferase
MVYLLERLFLGSMIRLYIRKIEGVHNLLDRPLVVAANHSSYLDDLIVPYVIIVKMKKRFSVFVNSRYYKNYFFRKFLSHYGGVPVDVEKDVRDEEKRRRTNERAIGEAIEALSNGRVFLIFPEGGRSPDGRVREAKTGVARVALSARVPVVPVGIKGSYAILPKGAVFPRFKRADVIIGEPLSFDRYYGMEGDHAVLREVTTMIMREICRLVSQECQNGISAR